MSIQFLQVHYVGSLLPTEGKFETVVNEHFVLSGAVHELVWKMLNLKRKLERHENMEALQFANMGLAAFFTELLIRLPWFTGIASRFYCP